RPTSATSCWRAWRTRAARTRPIRCTATARPSTWCRRCSSPRRSFCPCRRAPTRRRHCSSPRSPRPRRCRRRTRRAARPLPSRPRLSPQFLATGTEKIMRTRRWALVARLLSFLAVAGAATSAARAHEPDEEHAPDTAPSPLERVEAVYPPEARAAGVSGAVGLELAVDANGNVTDVKVTRPAGFGFDDAAVAAARQLKFRPATHDGKPIAATVVFEQRFTLRPRIVAETTAEGAAPPPMPEAVATPAPGPSYESTVTSRGPI